MTDENSVIDRILINTDSINERVARLAAQINADYMGQSLVLVGILKGSVPFIADLMRKLSVDAEIDFMAVSSYGKSTKSSGAVRILKDLDIDIMGKNVLICEDIVDTGRTLSYLKEILSEREPTDIKICTLLSKPSRREVPIHVDYIGFDIPDEFVVGYGLDYGEKYRSFPYVGVLKREI